MDIRVIPIEQKNAASYNPRAGLQPGDPEYEKLRQSIEAFGYLAFSVVDLDEQQEKLPAQSARETSGF
ncbi:hypothetical protein [Paenibacillus caui]|uniref:hypothetical protein n=1 Tax=Paenibacillus caui TaxID=2873927 RepID=UPI001F2E9644|nr:hypothetical protein [Paenibacillus caui]